MAVDVHSELALVSITLGLGRRDDGLQRTQQLSIVSGQIAVPRVGMWAVQLATLGLQSQLQGGREKERYRSGY